MHNETLDKLTNAAKNKINMLNSSKAKYLVSSAFAGLYVGLGIILIFTIGGLLTSTVYNLVAVTIGNMIGGALFMGTGVYILGTEKSKSNIKQESKVI